MNKLINLTKQRMITAMCLIKEGRYDTAISLLESGVEYANRNKKLLKENPFPSGDTRWLTVELWARAYIKRTQNSESKDDEK